MAIARYAGRSLTGASTRSPLGLASRCVFGVMDRGILHRRLGSGQGQVPSSSWRPRRGVRPPVTRSSAPYRLCRAPHAAARAAGLRHRHGVAGRRDRRGAPDGAVLRRLDDRVGEHDRDRAGGAVGRLLAGRAARRPPPRPARAVPAGRCSRPVLLALVPLVADPFLSLSVKAFDEVSVGAFAGSLFGVLALVAVPVLLLGAVSPWAIRLKVDDRLARGRGRGAAVRDLDRRLAVRHVPGGAGADPAGRDAADVPGVRRWRWPRWRRTGWRGRAVLVPVGRRGAAGDPGRHDQGRRRRRRA